MANPEPDAADQVARIVLFSTWRTQVSDFSDYDISTAELPVREIIQRTAAESDRSFPTYDNFKPTLQLCDQFLDGKVDLDLLKRVSERGACDFEQIVPFIHAFTPYDKGRGYGMPMAVMTFGYPLQLADYIQANIDENGLVVGLSPDRRMKLKSLVNEQFSTLARYPKVEPEPA